MDSDWKSKVKADMLNKYPLNPENSYYSQAMLYLRNVTFMIDIEIPYLYTDFFNSSLINESNKGELIEYMKKFNPEVLIDQKIIIVDQDLCKDKDFYFYELDDDIIKKRDRLKFIKINDKDYKILHVLAVNDKYIEALYNNPIRIFEELTIISNQDEKDDEIEDMKKIDDNDSKKCVVDAKKYSKCCNLI